jgi:hypothetical protein
MSSREFMRKAPWAKRRPRKWSPYVYKQPVVALPRKGENEHLPPVHVIWSDYVSNNVNR